MGQLYLGQNIIRDLAKCFAEVLIHPVSLKYLSKTDKIRNTVITSYICKHSLYIMFTLLRVIHTYDLTWNSQQPGKDKEGTPAPILPSYTWGSWESCWSVTTRIRILWLAGSLPPSHCIPNFPFSVINWFQTQCLLLQPQTFTRQSSIINLACFKQYQ